MNSISIIVNGEERSTNVSTLKEFLAEIGFSLSTTLVEQNGIALHRHEMEAARLSQGDRLEILKIVAGG